ncbi:hypothetical protein C474_13774 [Halogeometricum pallidum JCM 14848]|uniref:PIN domain-containing protein n=1 Tax=Halogeometricum pallidum JCM 14848 TaxID=1227487 RepID=M0D0J7_HALPD|nr:hypothetical protein [Halogeometricum pallidum]ELZ28975.1 hypothetical protein C474_13774 [Halogeometricum pallidum JCM 14848]
MSAIHIADTGLFVSMGHPSNRRFQVVRAFVRRNNMTFVLPERVYDELTANTSDVETPPIDTAISEGWARVADPLEYSHGLVSRTMDGVQRYIANTDDRPADEIERADPALAGVAAQAFVKGTADHAYIYTTDTLAGEGAENVFASEGYGDSVTYVNGFRFVEDLLE